MYDVIIIGAGPAGLSAGLSAAKAKLNNLIVTKEISVVKAESADIIDGKYLQRKFKKALLEKQSCLELKDKTEVIGVEKNVVSFSVETKRGEILYCRSIIIATGKSETAFDLLTYKDGTSRIKVDARMRTNVPGIFAVGEANDAGKKNLLAAAGEGTKAALSAMEYLKPSSKYEKN